MNESLIILFTFLILTSFLFFLTFNPIESVLWLMLTCAALAFYLFIANAPFFAGSLVILYVSAITVLFVYVVLMLPTRKVSFVTSFNFFLYLNSVLFLCLILLPTLNDFSSFVISKPTGIPIDELGFYLFTDGSFNFVLLTIIFFITLIGLFLLQ